MTEKAVAYYRVSTSRQGASGLGLDAQRSAVEALCAQRGWQLIAPPFQEIESGKRDDRPELAKALRRAKLAGAVLVIAKLDRLSRNARFLIDLQESCVRFVAADMPDANELTVGIMALVARQEREAISKRTKEALAAAKVRGQRLGNPNGAAALRRADRGNGAAIERVRANTAAWAEEARPDIEELQARGITSLSAIAKALNESGAVQPRRGGRWHASSVRNLLARLEATGLSAAEESGK